MAVAVQQQPAAAGPLRVEIEAAVRVRPRHQLLEGLHALGEQGRVRVVRQQRGVFVADGRHAARLQTDDRHSGARQRRQPFDGGAGGRAGAPHQSLGEHRAPAAAIGRHGHRPAGPLQHLGGGARHLRRVEAVEGVDEQRQRPARTGRRAFGRRPVQPAAARPRGKRTAAERRQGAPGADAREPLQQPPHRRGGQHPIDRAGERPGQQSAGAADVGEQPGAERQPVAVVVGGQELDLDLGHVDRGRTLGLARLALDAEVHHVEHALAGQFVVRQRARQRRAQRVGAAARGVLLVARGHEARTHGALGPLAADAGAVAHLHGAREAVVAAEGEPLAVRLRTVVRAVAQHPGHGRRVDHVAGVEDAAGIEGALDLPVEPVQVRPEEALVLPAARAAIAVFARQAAPEPAEQLQREAGDDRQLVDLGGDLGVDQRPDVDAAGAGVGVIGDARADVVAEPLDAGDVLGQMLDRHRGVLDERDRLVVALDAHHQAESDLADRPHVGLQRGVERRHHGGAHAVAAQVALQRVDPPLQRARIAARVLGDQHAVGRAGNEAGHQPRVLRHLAGERQPQVVEQLHRRRIGLQDGGHRRQRREQLVEVDHGQRGVRGHRHQVEGQLGHHRQRSLRPADQLGQIEAGILRVVEAGAVDEPVQVVAAAAPPVGRRAGQDRPAAVGGDGGHAAVELALQTRLGLVRGQPAGVQRPEPAAGAVAEDRLHAEHVVGGHAVPDRVGAGRVVADDPPHRRAVAGGGVGAELQPMRAQVAVERIEDDAGLQSDPALLRVELHHAVQEPGSVDDQRLVDRLPGQAAAGRARQDRHPMAGGRLYGGVHVLFVTGDQHAVRHHLIDAGVGAVEDAGIGVGAQLAAHPARQFRQEVGDSLYRLARGRRRRRPDRHRRLSHRSVRRARQGRPDRRCRRSGSRRRGSPRSVRGSAAARRPRRRPTARSAASRA